MKKKTHKRTNERTHFDDELDKHRRRSHRHKEYRSRGRDQDYEPIITNDEVHFDNLDNLVDPYTEDHFRFDHRPLKSSGISNQYPFKPHRFGKSKRHNYMDSFDRYGLTSKEKSK